MGGVLGVRDGAGPLHFGLCSDAWGGCLLLGGDVCDCCVVFPRLRTVSSGQPTGEDSSSSFVVL